ncbi:prepilin-type N-terminal cleavage/methylation domain-containing protein [Bremerella sp. JC770]|uniref:prepilin-type N-terminal cleavage/methylation domain-containing protein n=1 Tax=Bremerella sp. JC770 TaxID=3232137 RepID=UPI00345B03C0
MITRPATRNVRSTPQPAAVGERRAFTLLELLLVLAILVVLVGLGTPAVLNSLKGHRLTISAEHVQTQFMQARVDAMESGRIRMFRFQQETGNFAVAPFVRSSDELENNLAGTSQGIGVSSVVLDSVEAETINGMLEEGVVFAGDNIEADIRSYTLEQEQGGDMDISGWSRPILFYPDGTASDATVFLRGDGGTITSVKLRGLTGIARVQDPDLEDGGVD